MPPGPVLAGLTSNRIQILILLLAIQQGGKCDAELVIELAVRIVRAPRYYTSLISSLPVKVFSQAAVGRS